MADVESSVQSLLTEARQAVQAGDLERSRELVRAARQRQREHGRSGRLVKRRTCDGCDVYLAPSRTARVRLQDGHVAITCRPCGAIARYPYQARDEP